MSQRLLMAIALGIGVLGATAAARADDIVVYVEPPPVRVEPPPPPMREMEAWDPGHWAMRHGEWVWIPGHVVVVRERGHHWEPGRWVDRHGSWVWIEGGWR